MSNDKSPRGLQQQPARDSDPQQQRSGAPEARDRGPARSQSSVEGEGSYTATRDYQNKLKDYLETADVEADAAAARPRSEQEARGMEEAEREAKSHSKGER